MFAECAIALTGRSTTRSTRSTRENQNFLIDMSLTKCPKCKCADLYVTEVIEAHSEHLVMGGVWIHSYDNNEYGDAIRTECKCTRCGYVWVGHKGTSIENYITREV